VADSQGELAPADFVKRLEQYCHVISPAASPAECIGAGAAAVDSVTSRKAQEREKILALQKKMKERKRIKETENVETQKVEETKRREDGKAIRDAERAREESVRARETQQAAARAREAREARKLKHTAAAHKASPAAASAAAASTSTTTRQPRAHSRAGAAASPLSPESDAGDAAAASAETRVRLRLPSRTTLKHVFSADATVNDVRRFVQSSDEFMSLGVGQADFRLEVDEVPRREIRPSETTLRELDLVPRAALHVVLDMPLPAHADESEGTQTPSTSRPPARAHFLREPGGIHTVCVVEEDNGHSTVI
jgi:hypothetical protein